MIKHTIIALALIVVAITCEQACHSWTYPGHPQFPQDTDVVTRVIAQPDLAGFLFKMHRIPFMDNVLTVVSDHRVLDSENLPLLRGENDLSSGSDCKYNNQYLECPNANSPFKNKQRFNCVVSSYSGCKTLDCDWIVTIKEAQADYNVKKRVDGSITHYTFDYYLSYLTPDHNSPAVWGDNQQTPFVFKTSFGTPVPSVQNASLLAMTYEYSANPSSHQAKNVFHISTRPTDAVLNLEVSDHGQLSFVRQSNWTDYGYAGITTVSSYELPTDNRPVQSSIGISGTYCKDAKRGDDFTWTCSEAYPFNHVIPNHGYQMRAADKEADLSGYGRILHSFDCSFFDRSDKSPVVIGDEGLWVVWITDDLTFSGFEIKGTPQFDLLLQDSWLGQGWLKFPWQRGDYNYTSKPSLLPAQFDKSIKESGKVFVAFHIFSNEHTSDIKADGHEGKLVVKVNVLPKGGNDIKSTWVSPIFQADSTGATVPLPRFPVWAWVLIGVGSAALVAVGIALVIVGVVAHKRRNKKYEIIY
ncbi:nuoH [Acrasis kona]|uniref:NuoH n=1 Tax=Acrasis kona TaxID=1008807 RepID=A0AAW2YKX4_9EUKA